MNPQGPPQSALLVELAHQEFTLGCTPAGMAFAVPVFGSNVARQLRGGRQGLRGALARQFTEAHGKPPSASALADALLVLEAEALEAIPRDLHLRVARDDKRVILDLGWDDGQVVEITPGGWELRQRSLVLFRRSELTDRLPKPERDGSLDALWGLVNVAAADRPLVLGWLVAALFEDIPHPIMLLRGLQGAAKSTTARTLVSLLDPSAAPLRSLPSDLDGWSVAASGSWLVALDNVSRISEWQSDALCRAVTGDGLVKRRLYSDDSLAVLSFRRALMLTGIDVGALRGDLADRLLVIELEAIAAACRLQDADLATNFRAAHPALLGALLDLAAQVLAALPSLQLRESPRMADFAHVLGALDLVLGTEALARYSGQAAGLAVEVVESDPIAEALLREFPPGQEWEGTVSSLLERITPERQPRGWPQSGRGLSGRLRRLAPSLSQVGLDIDFTRARVRSVTITRRAVVNEGVGAQPSQPSQPSSLRSEGAKTDDGRPQIDDGRSPVDDGRSALVAVARVQDDGCDGCDGRIATPLLTPIDLGPDRPVPPPEAFFADPEATA
ncbi:MAG: ATP-binding protein [Candidatus Dormibacteria bacterium]